MIRPVTQNDAEAITCIYNPYITDTIITFEEQPVTTDRMRKRINTVTQRFPWLVTTHNEEVTGYAYATDWHERSAYRYACEVSVYLAPNAHGKGLGTGLYQHLFPLLKSQGMRTAIAGISLPNAASIALHEKLGFRKVAHFDAVGVKFGKSIDVGYWQLHF